jgi:hypothetical protein
MRFLTNDISHAAQGYSAESMKPWKLHWDHQLYKGSIFPFSFNHTYRPIRYLVHSNVPSPDERFTALSYAIFCLFPPSIPHPPALPRNSKRKTAMIVALEHQYQMGLESLNENLAEIKVDLVLKQQRLQVR